MMQTINSDYFLKQRQPVDLCNGEVRCFLCGTDGILNYYSDELRLQRVNDAVISSDYSTPKAVSRSDTMRSRYAFRRVVKSFENPVPRI
jgi:hypothetical protein